MAKQVKMSRVRCVHCGNGFGTHRELERHLRDLHMGSPNKIARCCISCGTVTTELEKHMVDKHLKQQRVFGCRVCEKSFNLPGPRNQHEWTDHTNKECEVVGFKRLQ